MADAEELEPVADGDGLDLLPTADVEILNDRSLRANAKIVGNEIHLVISNYPVGTGYDHAETDLLLRLPRQWPDGTPDMFWTAPHLKVAATGAWPTASAKIMSIDGREWQRWSRHYRDRWRPGVDGLENLLTIVNREMAKDVSR